MEHGMCPLYQPGYVKPFLGKQKDLVTIIEHPFLSQTPDRSGPAQSQPRAPSLLQLTRLCPSQPALACLLSVTVIFHALQWHSAIPAPELAQALVYPVLPALLNLGPECGFHAVPAVPVKIQPGQPPPNSTTKEVD